MTRTEAIDALAALDRNPLCSPEHADKLLREDIGRVLDAYTASLGEEVDYVKEEPDYEYNEK
jgi:hypothetical protein